MGKYLNYNEEIVPGCHFTWGEYALQQRWMVLDIPSPQQKANAEFLFKELRDRIRVPLGKSLRVSSGSRSPSYVQYLRSQNVPAALNSAHNHWQGIDLLAPVGMTNGQFWQYCHERWPGRMENLSATPGWVHLDTREWGKRIRFNP